MSTETTMQNYQGLALRTESPITPELIERLTGNARAVHAFFGLLTETGELADGFKRAIFYGKPLDTTNIKEEVGDVFWYLAILCDTLGISFDDCMVANIEKLRKRYPDKYSHEAALNRDLSAERKVLEGNADLIAADTKADTGPLPEEEFYGCQACGKQLAKCPIGTAGICTDCKGTSKLKDATLPEGSPTLGELLNKPPKELPFINGFDVARELASWMDGQTRKRALLHIDRREQQYKEQISPVVSSVKVVEPKKSNLQYCIKCDGCGWYEGGTSIKTNCEDCKGTGVIPC